MADLDLEPTQIRYWRTKLGLSQVEFVQVMKAAAAELGEHEPGVTAQMISNWETGKITPRPRNLRLAAAAIERTLEERNQHQEADMQRRTFLTATATTGLSVLGGGLAQPGAWRALGAALQQPNHLSATALDNLKTLTTTFAELFVTAVPATMVNPVRSHLDTLIELIRSGSHPDPVRRELASLAAETAILLGWITKDLGDQGSAQQYYMTAIQAAAEADDKPLGAYAIASTAGLQAFRANPEDSIYLLTDAEIHGIKATDAIGATRAYVFSLQGESHGRAGNATEAFTALDRAANDVNDDPGDDDRRPRLAFFDDTRLVAERGFAAVRLNQPGEGEDSLVDALAAMPPDRRIRSRFLTSLAKAQLQQGNYEQACETAIESLDVTRRSNVNIATTELQDFRQELSLTGSRKLVERLDGQLQLMAPY